MTLAPKDEAEIIRQMEEKGPEQVRLLMMSGNWPGHLTLLATNWLKEKTQVSERLRDASQQEQISIAREAKDAAIAASSAATRAADAAERQARAAEKANTRATVALIIAAISIIVTGASIWIGHQDAAHISH